MRFFVGELKTLNRRCDKPSEPFSFCYMVVHLKVFLGALSFGEQAEIEDIGASVAFFTSCRRFQRSDLLFLTDLIRFYAKLELGCRGLFDGVLLFFSSVA